MLRGILRQLEKKTLGSNKSLERFMMKSVCVFRGYGMHETDSQILHRVMSEHVCPQHYTVEYVTPEEIINDKLAANVTLLVIGGGFDKGLIKSLGANGMANIRRFVEMGGSYLGICSGAYFACDHIEFDKGGPLEVAGDRYLKFYPGKCVGPLYKTYCYKTKRGSASALIDFKYYTPGNSVDKHIATIGTSEEILNEVGTSRKFHNLERHEFKVYFSGGGQFIDDSDKLQSYTEEESDQLMVNLKNGMGYDIPNSSKKPRLSVDTQSHGKLNKCSNESKNSDTYEANGLPKVTVLSRFVDLPTRPVAMVKCEVGKGVAVLSGTHFEYEAADLDEGDVYLQKIIPDLRNSTQDRKLMIKSVLQHLNIHLKSGEDLPHSKL